MLNPAFGRRLLAAGFAVAAGLSTAHAQEFSDAHTSEQRIAGGGEFSGVMGPEDDAAFFNFTDYSRNTMRIAQLRLFGEWRPAARLSVIGELRTENLDDITAPGLYVRWRPLASRALFVHAGRIPPLFGGFPRHAYGRDNLVIGQPLAYQYLTSLRSDALPETINDILRMRGRGWLSSYPVGAPPAPGVPLMSVSKWDTGAAVLWTHNWLDAGVALTRGSPAVPVVEETNDGLMWSGRAAVHLPAGVTVGFSGAHGQWLANSVLALTPNGFNRASDQLLVGTDVELGVGKWLVRGEWLHATFEVPLALTETPDIRLHAWSGFMEGRYRLHPRWQIGLRGDWLGFSDVQATPESPLISWDADVKRVEGTLGFRATRHIEVRGSWQYNWRDGGRVREDGVPAVAILLWF